MKLPKHIRKELRRISVCFPKPSACRKAIELALTSRSRSVAGIEAVKQKILSGTADSTMYMAITALREYLSIGIDELKERQKRDQMIHRYLESETCKMQCQLMDRAFRIDLLRSK